MFQKSLGSVSRGSVGSNFNMLDIGSSVPKRLWSQDCPKIQALWYQLRERALRLRVPSLDGFTDLALGV